LFETNNNTPISLVGLHTELNCE